MYLWKTDLSASMVTEVGPLAMAALSCGTDLEATLVYERTSVEVVKVGSARGGVEDTSSVSLEDRSVSFNGD